MRLYTYRKIALRNYFILVVLLACNVAGAASQSQEPPDSEVVDAAFTTVARDYGADTAAGAADCNYFDDGSIIDVLALYTYRARLNNKSNDIHAYIQANVDTMHTVFRNSRVRPRIRVVDMLEVPYDESFCATADCTIDLIIDHNERLEHIHWLRDAYNADIVVLYVHCVQCGGDAACCHHDRHILNPSGGFAVVASDWDLHRLWGTVHELGHVMGCGHNRDAHEEPNVIMLGCRADDWSYGYDFIGDSGGWNSTMMSAGPALCGGRFGGLPCKLWDSNTCPNGVKCRLLPTYDPDVPYEFKIPYFSNPDVYFDGRPTGLPVGDPNSANCVLTINTRAFDIANYRQRPGNIWVDFAYSGSEDGCFWHPYNTLSEGDSRVPEDGTLIFKAGSSLWTGTIGKRYTMKAFGGVVRIGG